MRVAIRCDASPAIGAGHWSRCLVLARALVRSGADVRFLCRDDAGSLSRTMVNSGLPIHWLPAPCPLDALADAEGCAPILSAQRFDWLVLDRYGLAADWQTRLRPHVRRILVIDDLAATRHDCDLLLNPNLPVDRARYKMLVPDHCRLMLGPEYALLGSEFLDCIPRVRNGQVKRLLVSFGGSDPPNASRLTLLALNRLEGQGALADIQRIVMIAGPGHAQWPELLKESGLLPRLRLRRATRMMAAQLQAADLVIGAAGGSLWERCWLGVPALVMALVDHQHAVAQVLARRGAVRYLGPVSVIDIQTLSESIGAALREPAALREMSIKARRVMGQVSFARNPRQCLEAA